jgi:chromosome segregation ATPase
VNPQLSAAIKARDESAAEVDRLTEQLAKLERAIASTSPAIAELASIRHQAEAEMEAWSAAGGEGKMPTADHGAIAKLEAEISAHASSIASAQTALQSVIARREAAKARHASVVKYVSISALLALVAEEDPKLIAEIETAQQKLLDLDATRTTLRKFLSAQADVIKERELFVALERTDAVRLPSIVGKANMDTINARLAELQTGANVEAI